MNMTKKVQSVSRSNLRGASILRCGSVRHLRMPHSSNLDVLNFVILTFFILLSQLLMGCTLTPTVASLPSRSPVAAEAALHKLVTRMFDDGLAHTRRSDLIPAPPEVMVGTLPDSLPFEVPLPEGTVIVGSLTRTNIAPSVSIFLEAPLPADTAFNLYRAHLEEQGFTVWQPDKSRVVFNTDTPSILLCHREKEIQLYLTIQPLTAQLSDVRLMIDTDPIFVSCDDNTPQMTTYAQSLLPELTLPAGAIPLSSGGGGGYEGWAEAEQNFISTATPVEVDLHLQPQLEAAGWVLIDHLETGPVVWSRWALTDAQSGQWEGVLVITAGAGTENSRVVRMHIERQP